MAIAASLSKHAVSQARYDLVRARNRLLNFATYQEHNTRFQLHADITIGRLNDEIRALARWMEQLEDEEV